MPDPRPRATLPAAIADGWQRVLRAPALVLGTLAATLLLSLPLGAALESARVGPTPLTLGPAPGADAGGGPPPSPQSPPPVAPDDLPQRLTDEIVGVPRTLLVARDLVAHTGTRPAILGAIAAYLALWIFLWGGILDRLARRRPVRTAAFFAACGVYLVRFLRLAVPVALAYTLAVRWIYLPALVADHRALLALALLVLVAIRLVAEVAAVRAVVEDRRSMIGALVASLRFVRRRPLRVVTVYAIHAVALFALAAAWQRLSEGAIGAADTALWVVWTAAAAYLLLRLWVRLALASSLIAFFQQELAHAAYTAAPLPVWPDSPAAEALDNLQRLGEVSDRRGGAALSDGRDRR